MAKGREQYDWKSLETILSRAVLKNCSFRVNSLLSWFRVKCESAARDLENTQRNGNLFHPLLQKSVPEGNSRTRETNRGCSWLNETTVLQNSLQGLCISER